MVLFNPKERRLIFIGNCSDDPTNDVMTHDSKIFLNVASDSNLEIGQQMILINTTDKCIETLAICSIENSCFTSIKSSNFDLNVMSNRKIQGNGSKVKSNQKLFFFCCNVPKCDVCSMVR